MFYLAERLTGGMGTRYSSNHVGLEYAHIDGGKENPGYFTYKSATHDFQKGDTNSDGTVDVADITAIICYMAGQAAGISKEQMDVNGDGTVDVADITAVISIMATRARAAQSE